MPQFKPLEMSLHMHLDICPINPLDTLMRDHAGFRQLSSWRQQVRQHQNVVGQWLLHALTDWKTMRLIQRLLTRH